MTRHEMEQPPFGFFQLFIIFILLLLLPPLLDLKGGAWVLFTSAGLMISSLYLLAHFLTNFHNFFIICHEHTATESFS